PQATVSRIAATSERFTSGMQHSPRATQRGDGLLDQLLHIDISPKNLPALSLIKHYGASQNACAYSIEKERIAPDGVSSNSQLDMEFSRQGFIDDVQIRNINETTTSNYELGSPPWKLRRRSVLRSANICSTSQVIAHFLPRTCPFKVLVPTATKSSCCLTTEVNQGNTSSEPNRRAKKMSRPAVVSPPFPRGLKITENYGSDGSINTRENSSNVIESEICELRQLQRFRADVLRTIREGCV
ncbi:uncharacterized protein CEXT_157411, partial [Caerostris extrusa]